MNQNLGSTCDITTFRENLDVLNDSLLQKNRNKRTKETHFSKTKMDIEPNFPHYMKEREKYRFREIPSLDAKTRQLRRTKFISVKPYHPPEVFIYLYCVLS